MMAAAGEAYLGLDLGGTKLLIGEMDAGGSILAQRRYPSGPLSQGEALRFIEASADDYLATGRTGRPIRAMGLGLVGRVDRARGLWYQIDSQRTCELPIGALLSARYGLPCYVENDVRSAAMAEAAFGSGRGSRDFIYINVGTGIAAGIVSGGRLLRGGHCNAGEVGHTQAGVDAGVEIPCECGRLNCVEAIASGLGLDKCARALAGKYPGTSLYIPQDGGRVSVRDIFDRAGSDPLCAHLADTAARAVAGLIMNLVRTSDPGTVVLGGGVVADGFLYPRILAALDKNNMRFVTHGVLLTGLDPALAGLMGACTLAMNREDLC
jgi:predicted NBD/HSP70 family sugar kinase